MGERFPVISRRWRPLALLGLLIAFGIYWSLVSNGLQSLQGSWTVKAPPRPPFTPAAPAPPPTPKPRRVKASVPADDEARASGKTDDAAPMRTVRVTVVAKDGGAPIEGAEVRVCARSDDDPRPSFLTAITGTDGVALLSTDRPRVRSLTVRKAGFLVDRTSDPTTPVDIDVALAAATVIRGHVVLADTREPAAGVAVNGFEGKRGTGGAIDVPQTTDARGRFELAGAPPDDDVRIFAVAPGYCWADAIVAKSNVGQDVEIVLGEGGVLEGTVTDVDGKPLPGVEVFTIPESGPVPKPEWAWDEDDAPFREMQAFIFPALHADAHGHFEFRGVILPRDGASRSRIAAARSVDGHEARSDPVTFTRLGERQTRDIRFPKPSSIVVRVKSATPLPEDAKLRARCDGNVYGTTVPLPDDGAPVTFRDVAVGDYAVTLSTSARSLGDWELAKLVLVGSGEDVSVEFVVDNSVRLTGRVVDENGRGVGKMRVSFDASTQSEHESVSAAVFTAEDGSFVLERLLPLAGLIRAGPNASINFVSTSHLNAGPFESVELRDVLPGGAPITITVRRLGKLIGRISPVPTDRNWNLHASSGGADGLSMLEFAEDGRFECDAPFVGVPMRIWMQDDGFAPAVFDVAPIASGETRDVGEIALASGLLLDGRLLDADGSPLARAKVATLEPWMELQRPTTGADGRFRIEGAPRRPLVLLVRATTTTPDTVLVVADPSISPAEFTISAGALVEGRVLGRDDRPRPGVRVTYFPGVDLTDSEDACGSVTTDASGRYSFRLQAGHGRVYAHDVEHDARSEDADLTVADGDKRTLDLVVR